MIASYLGLALVASRSEAATLLLTDCELTSDVVKGSATGRCGFYAVPEDRSNPASKAVQLHVAVIPALRKEALADPVVILTGGPGQAASDFYLSGGAAFERLRRDRDILLIDQRGTGKSNRLDCELPDELTVKEFNLADLPRHTQDCLSKLPGDPRYYTTSVAVRDLEEVRIALGYDKLNLYGISYGTRVAQHYLRRYPNRVRTIALDGVVPVDEVLGPQIGPAAQRAIDALFVRCEESQECSAAFPDLQRRFMALRSQVLQKPIPLVLADPRTGKHTSVEFGAAELTVAIRLLSYSDDSAALLPFLIAEASQRRIGPIAAQAVMVANKLTDQLANGMHNAVLCTEDTPFYTQDMLADSAIDSAYMGRTFVDTLAAGCNVWPRGVMDEDFHAALKSEVPALLLSGEHDPVTPARFGERAVKAYPNGRHIVFKGQGHGQFGSRCGASLLTRFIQTANATRLDAECVDRVSPTPFMLNANGPSP
jgi:pimeloyl-ACP methyl ester carboxylesterase